MQCHSERGSLTVAMTGRGRSSGPAHQHARIKPCRLAGVESAPMRDVWQPEAATRANSRGQSVHHNCRAHTRRVVMWSGRSKLIAPAAQTVLSACVGGVLAMPASVCHSLYTVCDGRRYAAFTSGPCTVLVRARCWRRNHVGYTTTVGGHVPDTVARSTACVHERYARPGRLQGRK